MADIKPESTVLAPAPTRTPMVDSKGIITAPWVMFLQKIHMRVGGSYSLPVGSTAGAWTPVISGGSGNANFQTSYLTLGNQLFFDVIIDALDSTFGISGGSITLPFPALSPGTVTAINLDPSAPYHDFGNGRIVDGNAFPPDFSIDHQKALLSGRYQWQ